MANRPTVGAEVQCTSHFHADVLELCVQVSLLLQTSWSGRGCNGCIARSPSMTRGIGWTLSDVFLRMETLTAYEDMNNWIDGVHGALHVIIGGIMAYITDAPADPAFFAHHSMVEWVLWWWQVNNVLTNQGDTFSCQSCHENIAGYNVPREEWLGAGYDADLGCIKIPKSDPRVCLRYEKFRPTDEEPGPGLKTFVPSPHPQALPPKPCNKAQESNTLRV